MDGVAWVHRPAVGAEWRWHDKAAPKMATDSGERQRKGGLTSSIRRNWEQGPGPAADAASDEQQEMRRVGSLISLLQLERSVMLAGPDH